MRIPFVAASLLAGHMALADCPPSPDVTSPLQALIEQAQTAQSFGQAQGLSVQMWALWLKAPDDAAQSTLDAGMRRRDVSDFAGALVQFDRLVEYCPAYAEGYNQRAFTHYLSGSYKAALADLDLALQRQPLHIGALSGRALTLMQMGERAAAREQMLEAVELNPWLSERALLEEGAPLGPQGEEL